MLARDIFRNFHYTRSFDQVTFMAANDEPESLRSGVYSSIYRSLLKRETGTPASMFGLPYNQGLTWEFIQSMDKKLPPPVLNQDYQEMLLWLMDNDVRMTLADKDPQQAKEDLLFAGADERLLPLIQDYKDVYSSPMPPFEVLISSEFIPVRTHIVIEPELSKFTDFLKRKLYKTGDTPSAPDRTPDGP